MVSTAAAALGAVIDLAQRFGICAPPSRCSSSGASFFVAARVHREDLLAAMVMSPVYAVISVIAAYAEPPGLASNTVCDSGPSTSTTLSQPRRLRCGGTSAVAAIVVLRRGRQLARRRQ